MKANQLQIGHLWCMHQWMDTTLEISTVSTSHCGRSAFIYLPMSCGHRLKDNMFTLPPLRLLFFFHLS
jgi:hypothetical protein